MRYSEKQLQAVEHRRGALLVSAAAGSGKTTTMVGHVLKLLEEDSIDRLIILTFTRAAAGEMRQRIMKALSDLLEKEPGNQHIRQQLFAAGNAYIGTIDSFCIKLVRDYFDRLDLAPDLRIADGRELDMMKDEILEELFREAYEEGRESFLNLRTDFSSEKNHEDLKKMILELHGAAQNDPDPRGWLEGCRHAWGEDSSGFFQSREALLFYQGVLEQLEQAAREREALADYLGSGIEDKIRGALERDGQQFRHLLSAPDPQSLLGAISRTVFDERLQPKDKETGAVLKRYRGSRKGKSGYLSCIGRIENSFRGRETEWQFLKRTEEPTGELVRLTLLFGERFEAACREKSLAGFAEVEHYALQLLMQKNQAGGWEPTPLAMELRGRYREVIVDEYQDVNQLQEYILQALAGENLFMVGDVKQSIYRFRRAKPAIFVRKFLEFDEAEDSLTRRVDLSENHRSSPAVLAGANELFQAIMTRDCGGVDYDEKVSLKPAPNYRGGGCSPRTLLIETDANAEERARQGALAIAGEIRRLTEEGAGVYDKEEQAFRPLRPRDFVILLRSLSRAQIYAQTLQQCGIPASFPRKKGFYEQGEIKLMLSLLSLADNPRQDVPLAAVMLSPLGGFSPDDLVRLRGRDSETGSLDLWGRLQAGKEEPRCRGLLESIETWRRLSAYLSLPDYILKLCRISGLESYLQAHPEAGNYANIRLLVNLAEEFESGYGQGLYHFLRYIELQKKMKLEDRGEAEHLPGGLEAVEINTIHSSKGLEYPVVFLGEADKEFSTQDLKGDYLTDEEEGIALKSKDAEHYVKSSNLFLERVREKLKQENLSEEIRLLYVAMTRARERFYLVGGLEDAEEAYAKRRLLDSPSAGPLPASAIREQKSYLQLYLLAAANRQLPHFEEIRIRPEELLRAEDYQGKPMEWPDQDGQSRTGSDIQRIPYPEAPLLPGPYVIPEGMKAAYSVSELTRRGEEKERAGEKEFYYPAWLQCGDSSETAWTEMEERQEGEAAREEQRRLSAGERGTAYHKLMEHLPWALGDDLQRLAAFLEELERKGIFSREEKESIRPEQVAAFFKAEVGRRSMQAFKAGKLWREQPFLTRLPYSEICPESLSAERVLVQGILDLFFEEEGKLVLVDYKTDRDVTPEILIQRHGEQLRYYARALISARNQPLAEVYIYSFDLGSFVRVSM